MRQDGGGVGSGYAELCTIVYSKKGWYFVTFMSQLAGKDSQPLSFLGPQLSPSGLQ